MPKDRKSESPKPRAKPKSRSKSSHKSSSRSRKSSSESRSKDVSNKRTSKSNWNDTDGKIFISHLDPNENPQRLEDQLRELLSKKCTVERITVRKNSVGSYSYAFLDIKEYEKTEEIISTFNNQLLNGRRIVVERKKPFQARQRPPDTGRRNTNCYRCGKQGHFARQCPKQTDIKPREKSRDIASKHRKRQHSSESRQNEKRKSKTHRYRTRDKKHDKKKRHHSSDSSSVSSSSDSSSSSSSSSSSERKYRSKRREKKDKHKKRQAKRKERGKGKRESSQSS